jgi:hypothetical protein
MDEQAASVLLDLEHDCEELHCDLALQGLCDQAMDEQAASVLLDLELDCEALGGDSRTPRRSWPDLEIPKVDIEPLLRDWAPEVDIGLLGDGAQKGEHDRTDDDLCASALKELEEHPHCYVPEKVSHSTAVMAMTMPAPAADFETFQASLEHYYDLDEQAASLLLDLEHDCEELHCDLALEGLCDQAMDEQAASVLLDLELDCEALGGDSRTPDLEILKVDIEPLRDWAPEVDIGLLRDGVPEGEHCCTYDDLCASALKKLEEHCQRLHGELESANHHLFCTGLRGRLIQRVRKTLAEYLLWAL